MVNMFKRLENTNFRQLGQLIGDKQHFKITKYFIRRQESISKSTAFSICYFL